MTDRLGALDQCALYALKTILDTLEKDDAYADLLEQHLIETSAHAADLAAYESDGDEMDEYYRLLDRFRVRVLRRTGLALADLYRWGPLAQSQQPITPVARAYTARYPAPTQDES